MERIERAEQLMAQMCSAMSQLVDLQRGRDALMARLDLVQRPANFQVTDRTATNQVKTLPQGEAWGVQRLVITGPANANIIIGHSDTSPTRTVHVVNLDADGFSSETFASELHVPGGTLLVARCDTLGDYTFNMQVRRYRIAEHHVPAGGTVVEEHVEEVPVH